MRIKRIKEITEYVVYANGAESILTAKKVKVGSTKEEILEDWREATEVESALAGAQNLTPRTPPPSWAPAMLPPIARPVAPNQPSQWPLGPSDPMNPVPTWCTKTNGEDIPF